MANQGILAQSKPAANTDTLLYSAPVDKSASTVLNVANDGTGSTFDVGQGLRPKVGGRWFWSILIAPRRCNYRVIELK